MRNSQQKEGKARYPERPSARRLGEARGRDRSPPQASIVLGDSSRSAAMNVELPVVLIHAFEHSFSCRLGRRLLFFSQGCWSLTNAGSESPERVHQGEASSQMTCCPGRERPLLIENELCRCLLGPGASSALLRRPALWACRRTSF